MASSTAQVAPAERRAQYEAAIAMLQAQDQPVTAEAVWRITGTRRGNVQAYVKAWSQQQREAPVAVPCPEVLMPGALVEVPIPRREEPPVPPPRPRLAVLRQAKREAEDEVRELAQEFQEAQQRYGELQSEERQALQDVRRLARECWQMQAQAGSPTFRGQPEMVAKAARLWAELVEWLGAPAARQAAEEGHYVPEGLR